MNDKKNLVAEHYDGSAATYHLQYERDLLSDLNSDYPANFFRLHLLLNSFIENEVKRVVEIGVGEGTPLVNLAKAGMEVAGCDISNSMVDACRANFESHKLSSKNIIFADIQDPTSYAPLLGEGKFDALLAMGVMPHVRNDEFVLRNMRTMVKDGGKVFIEFRNKLFSLFTFNRHTHDFILDDLLANVSPVLKAAVAKDLKSRLAMDLPKPKLSGPSSAPKDRDAADGVPGYDAILSKFHNPFEILEQFKAVGFKDARLLWYHYHPAMPYLEETDAALFRNEGLKLEHENSGWRGLFLCSAFVVEATKESSVD
jgi:2-polyprenyl-3-methyl-5-hydroxy-6-metoxy-1,4-benzoquinol methylase